MIVQCIRMLFLAVAVVILSSGHGVGSNGAPPSLPESVVARNLVPFTDQPWDRLVGNYWNYLRRSSSDDADVVVDTSAPYSAPNVLRIVFTPSLERDRQPTVHWISLPHVR